MHSDITSNAKSKDDAVDFVGFGVGVGGRRFRRQLVGEGFHLDVGGPLVNDSARLTVGVSYQVVI